MIIDTHCHLDDARFREDVDAVIEKAYKQGVQGIIIPGADIDDLGYAQELSHRYEHIYFAVAERGQRFSVKDPTWSQRRSRINAGDLFGTIGCSVFSIPRRTTATVSIHFICHAGMSGKTGLDRVS